MRKVLTTVLVVLLGLSMIGVAQAGKRRVQRTASGEYVASTSTTGIGVTWESPAGNISMVPFPVKAGERFASFEILDDSGFPTGGIVTFDLDGDGEAEGESVDFCAHSEQPIDIPRGTQIVHVRVGTGPCGSDNSLHVATSREVKATFSNLP